MQKTNWLALGVIWGSLCLTASSQAQDAEKDVKYQPFSISADASTLGLGGSVNWRFADHFGIHGGLNYFSYSEDGNDIEGVRYNTKLRLLSAPIGLDYFFSKTSSLRLTLGVLINRNQIEGVMPQLAPGQLITLGNAGHTYDQAIGALSMSAKQEPVSPYLSIGGSIFLDQAKHWAINGELGIAYTGSSEVTLSSSSGNPSAVLAQDLAEEAQQIEDKFDDYKLYPIVKVGVSFSF